MTRLQTKMPLHHLVIVLLLILLHGYSAAQNFEPVGKKYSIENGLQRMVFDLYQDADNYLWIATARGLYRYDGEQFEHFSLRDGLTDFLIYQLKEDQRGRLWGLTSTLQIFHFDPQLKDFTPYPHNDVLVDEVFHHFSFLTSVAVDSAGATYFGFEGEGKDGGLKISANGQTTWLGQPPQQDLLEIQNFYQGLPFSFANHQTEGLPSPITVLIRNGSDSLRVAFEKSPGKAGKVQLLADGTAYNAIGRTVLVSRGNQLIHRWDFPQQVVQISLPRDGSVWISTRAGTYRMGSEGPLETIYPHNVVTKVLVDHENATWLGILGGGLLYAPKTSATEIDLPGQNWPVSIHGLSDHSLLTCTIDGFLLQVKPQGLGGKWDLPQRMAHLSPEGRDCFLGTVNGDGIYRIRMGEDGLTYERIYAEEPDQLINIVRHAKLAEVMVDDTSFAVSPKAVVKIPKGKAPLIFPANLPDLPGSLYRTSPNEYLIGTPHGLYRYRDSLESLEAMSPLFKESIYQILPFGEDLLIPTFGRGVALWKANGETQTLDRASGLSGDIVNGALVLSDTLALVGTNHGVDLVFRRDGQISCQPLLDNALYRVLDPQSFAIQGDTLWIGHHSGLMRLFLTDLKREAYSPELSLKEVVVGGDTLDFPGTYEAPFYNSSIVLQFKSISFREEKQFFEYKIDGLDAQWRQRTESRIEFLSLPAGLHRIRFRRCNPDHPNLCREIEVKVHIHPPIWQLWWFYLLGSALVLALGFGLFRRQHRKRLKAQALQNQLTQLELKSLRAQMNPHFIFNTINSIQHFILSHDVWEAQDYLAKFGRLIRKTLDSSRNEVIPLASEILILRDYISLEQLRLDQPFEVVFDLGADIDAATLLVPPLLLQPVVENAIWHGLAHRSSPGTLRIGFALQDGLLDCCIEDNGIGRAAHADRPRTGQKKSVGLEIIRDRLNLFNAHLPSDSLSILQIEDLYTTDRRPAGTRVLIRLQTVVEP